jgi:signal transduction histidine kinase
MSVRQTVVGLLGVVPSLPDQFSESHINLIERMAFDMASLAQDAILIDQAYTLAALEERNRLARELHDSVTQVLFSANLLAEVLPQVWRRDPEEGLRRLEKLRYLNKGALAEMRAMLLELRPTSVSNIPLSDLLTQLAEATTSRSGVNIVLEIEKVQTLPEPAHTNIYRIAQEALNNVVKHSQANKVVMILSTLPSPTDEYDLGGINLLIADDGVGFSTECVDSTHLGIGIMTERAQAIHAELTLESEPGHGTLIGLVWRRELRNPS